MAVCLHCLHTARLEAREHRQRAIMRFGAWTLSLAVVGVVGAAGVNAATHPDTPQVQRGAKRAQAQPIAVRAPSSPDSAAVTVASAAAVIQQGAPAQVASPAADSAHPASPNPAPAPISATQPPAASPSSSAKSVPSADSAARAAIGPIIPQGRTDLADSLFAIRVADTVVVHFDTSPSRTRRADKFETIVRQTLKVVYGPFADSTLAAVPAGRLVAPNELVTTLPTRGIHLAGPHGARVALWPETRPGRDGPLVIAYRTVVER
jgi:hypothetical protein